MHTLSIIIPSRNEPYLYKTIQDILKKATGNIEVIAILEGYWPPVEEIIDDPRVNYIHFSTPRGMRNAINSGVAIAKGDYILKCDAHVMFSEGFDQTLVSTCQDNWVVVPRRYALDPINWKIENNPKYPVDYMYLSNELHGVVWEEKNKDVKLGAKQIDDLMSSQGSCWMMKKSYYAELELLDEATYGKFWNEFQEIGLKAWLSGGAVKVNKGAWYAHWHKPKSVGRGYSVPNDQDKAQAAVEKWRDIGWHKQTKPLSWLIDKFSPIP